MSLERIPQEGESQEKSEIELLIKEAADVESGLILPSEDLIERIEKGLETEDLPSDQKKELEHFMDILSVSDIE